MDASGNMQPGGAAYMGGDSFGIGGPSKMDGVMADGMMAPGMMAPGMMKADGMMAPGMMAPGMMAPGMAPGPMGPGPAPMSKADRVEQIEKMHIKKLKADTYKQRRAEGRPKHGKTSITALGLGGLSLVLQTVVVFTPWLRSNRYGVFGYAAPRYWGFFGISGKRSQMWHQISGDTCGYWGSLNVGGVCASPICLWYRLKCEHYTKFMVMSYCLGIVVVVSYILHICCLGWTSVLSTRTIRYAGKTWPIITFANIFCVAAWFILSADLFDTLNDKSFYPEPEIGIGTIMGGLSAVALIVSTICGCQLWKWWPDLDLAEWDSSEDEGNNSDTDGEDTAKGGKKRGAKQVGDPAAMMQGAGAWQQQAMMDPGMAYMQQGYDMSQGGRMQYVQPQEGNGVDMMMGASAEGAGPTYMPGQQSDWESQPAELRKGATYMPQQPPTMEEQASAAPPEGAPEHPGGQGQGGW